MTTSPAGTAAPLFRRRAAAESLGQVSGLGLIAAHDLDSVAARYRPRADGAGHVPGADDADVAHEMSCPWVGGAVRTWVTAFNTIFGHVLAQGGRLDAFIAADDADAKARVSTFLESLGLRPLYVGGLQMAQTLEALGLMMIGLAKNGAGTFDIALHVDIG